MKMLRKINHCESLEISRESVCDGVFLVKLYAYSVQNATLLQRDFTTDFFPSIYRKVAVVKRIF